MTFADIPIGGKIETEAFRTFVKLTEDGLCCSEIAADMCFSTKEGSGDEVWKNNGCNIYHFSEINQRIRETDTDYVKGYDGAINSRAWKMNNLEGVEEHFVAKDIVTYTTERNVKSNFAFCYIDKVYGWLPSTEDIKESWWKTYVKEYPINGFWNYPLLFREGKGRSEVFYYNSKDGKIKTGPAYVERQVRPLYQMKTNTEMVEKSNGKYLIVYTASHDVSIDDSEFKSFLTL